MRNHLNKLKSIKCFLNLDYITLKVVVVSVLVATSVFFADYTSLRNSDKQSYNYAEKQVNYNQDADVKGIEVFNNFNK